MKKYTPAEKQYLKGIIRVLALDKNNDQQIQEYFKEKGIDIERSTIGKIRRSISKEAEKWYLELRKSKYLYIAHFKERIDTIYKVQNKLWDIANDINSDKSEKRAALSEIHKTEITLSGLYDIARYLTERVEKDGISTNNRPLRTEGTPEDSSIPKAKAWTV
jgi:hypothetical protein